MQHAEGSNGVICTVRRCGAFHSGNPDADVRRTDLSTRDAAGRAEKARPTLLNEATRCAAQTDVEYDQPQLDLFFHAQPFFSVCVDPTGRCLSEQRRSVSQSVNGRRTQRIKQQWAHVTNMQSKRKTHAEDDVTTEAQQHAQAAPVLVPSIAVPAPSPLPAALSAAAAAVLPTHSSGTVKQMQSTAKHVAGIVPPLSSHSSPSSPSAAAAVAPSRILAGNAAASSSQAACADGQTPSMVAASFDRLADVEVQLIMQQLDQPSLLHLARCSRALFHCASHPFAWQWLCVIVDVLDMNMITESRRSHSLLRFAPSAASILRDWSESTPDPVSCAMLSRVPQIVALVFEPHPHPLMSLDEWHLFLQHPNAQRLTDVHIIEQPALCGTDSLLLLSRLPLLRTLCLSIPATPSTSHFEPLANALSLTFMSLWGPDDTFGQPVSLAPLAQCTRLRTLQLNHLSLYLGHLSETLMQLARTGGQLQELWFNGVRIFPMSDSAPVDEAHEADEAVSLELSLATPSLPHLHTLTIMSAGSMPLEYLPSLPSLRMLNLTLELLPSAPKLDLLLRRLPHLRCTVHPFRSSSIAGWQQHTDLMLPQLQQLAQRCPRFVIEEDEDE
jgi:hypothetical protein